MPEGFSLEIVGSGREVFIPVGGFDRRICRFSNFLAGEAPDDTAHDSPDDGPHRPEGCAGDRADTGSTHGRSDSRSHGVTSRLTGDRIPVPQIGRNVPVLDGIADVSRLWFFPFFALGVGVVFFHDRISLIRVALHTADNHAKHVPGMRRSGVRSGWVRAAERACC